MLPASYSHERQYHCSFCSKILDRYYDFSADGSFKSDNYQCIGCEEARQYTYSRAYTPQALKYLTEKLHNPALSAHLRWNYTQQIQNLTPKNMVS